MYRVRIGWIFLCSHIAYTAWNPDRTIPEKWIEKQRNDYGIEYWIEEETAPPVAQCSCFQFMEDYEM